MNETRFHPITLAALLFMAMVAFALLSNREKMTASAAPEGTVPAAFEGNPAQSGEEPPQADPADIRAPYDNYILTQGPHEASLGHLAIDITAGKGSPILSPITGEVTALYTDQWGNPTLVIENQIWQVTLLHGNYKVAVGDQVVINQAVGYESNNGYTVDWQGNSCKGRDCGYHTHLNILDKRTGRNANPLEVLNP